jgi:hypothetical protein
MEACRAKYELIKSGTFPGRSKVNAVHLAIVALLDAKPGAFVCITPAGGYSIPAVQKHCHTYADRHGIKVQTCSREGKVYVRYIGPASDAIGRKAVQRIAASIPSQIERQGLA